MKKQILQTIFTLAGLMLFSSMSGATIVGSRHDFTPSGGSTFIGDNDQVCIYCHTPHAAIAQDRAGNSVPLWNRILNEGENFTMYGGSSATFDATYYADNKPTGPSLLCLSCHDGVTSIGGAILNPGAFGSITVIPDPIGFQPYAPYADINIGRDLSNDHPVSFEYNDTLAGTDGGLQDPDIVLSTTPLELYGTSGYRLECPTCHDPHEYGDIDMKIPFLRMSNDGSAMCRSCHLK